MNTKPSDRTTRPASRSKHRTAKGPGRPARAGRTRARLTKNLDTETRILDAAHLVFVRTGTAGARMHEIAREAGVNSALLHYYFKTKDRLSAAVFQRAAQRLFPSVLETMGSDLDLDEKVRRVIALELDRLSETPYLPGYVISEVTHHPERAKQLVAAVTGRSAATLLPAIFAKLTEQIDAAVRRGEMRPIAPDQFLVNLISLCVFPFAARAMLMALFARDEHGFQQFIDRRRVDLAPFVLGALRP